MSPAATTSSVSRDGLARLAPLGGFEDCAIALLTRDLLDSAPETSLASAEPPSGLSSGVLPPGEVPVETSLVTSSTVCLTGLDATVLSTVLVTSSTVCLTGLDATVLSTVLVHSSTVSSRGPAPAMAEPAIVQDRIRQEVSSQESLFMRTPK